MVHVMVVILSPYIGQPSFDYCDIQLHAFNCTAKSNLPVYRSSFFVTPVCVSYVYTVSHNYGNPWFLLYSF